jgi:hypothetical protein
MFAHDLLPVMIPADHIFRDRAKMIWMFGRRLQRRPARSKRFAQPIAKSTTMTVY